jgi:hypothetical protein
VQGRNDLFWIILVRAVSSIAVISLAIGIAESKPSVYALTDGKRMGTVMIGTKCLLPVRG